MGAGVGGHAARCLRKPTARVYDGTTGAFIKDIALMPADDVPYGQRLIEDLSFDYQLRPDTTSTPEPASMMLLGTGLLVVGFVTTARRRR